MCKNQGRMGHWMLGVAVLLASLASPGESVSDYYGLPPGPYCARMFPEGRCCAGRQDDCSVPIVSTRCYCDEFCERTDEDDCCPDFWTHCRGVRPNVTEAPPSEIRRCYYQGKLYNQGQTFKVNCNTCKCTSVGIRAEVLCEKNRCLMEPQLVEDINLQSSRLGWRSANYSEFWGRTLEEGLELRLGTLNPRRSVHNMNPIHPNYDPNTLPREFDARSRWPRDITGVHDQGWCGASWAISTADVASDRYAIMSKGVENVDLSAQHLLSCNSRGQQGCSGGYLDKAWHFVRRFGLVDEDCYLWIGKKDMCRIPRRANLRDAGCGKQPNPLRKEMYKVSPAYRMGNETDIMYEILTSGPVQATMRVHQDFFVYESGVYKHSRVEEHHEPGYHSVRIIGWGEEGTHQGLPKKYWLVANSWGHQWGENGLFRIERGTNECEIETYVIAVWTKTIKPPRRRR